jgi:hypothetical protein
MLQNTIPENYRRIHAAHIKIRAKADFRQPGKDTSKKLE